MEVQNISQEQNAVIRVDGYFDDWDRFEKGVVTYYSNNTLCKNEALLLKDDTYLYMYVGMNELYDSQIPLDSYNLQIGGRQLQFFIRYPSATGNIDWGRPVNRLPNGVTQGLGVFTYYPTYQWGDAVVEVTNGGRYNDRMEVRMKISDVEKLMGLEEGTIASGTKVQVNMPNVGNGNIFVEGSATGILLGLVIMLAVFLYAHRRNRKRGTRLRKKAGREVASIK